MRPFTLLSRSCPTPTSPLGILYFFALLFGNHNQSNSEPHSICNNCPVGLKLWKDNGKLYKGAGVSIHSSARSPTELGLKTLPVTLLFLSHSWGHRILGEAETQCPRHSTPGNVPFFPHAPTGRSSTLLIIMLFSFAISLFLEH